jgi:hypothetical protein
MGCISLSLQMEISQKKIQISQWSENNLPKYAASGERRIESSDTRLLWLQVLADRVSSSVETEGFDGEA